jgi:hypothetical protein
MINIEITDIGKMRPYELEALADYIMKVAENNRETVCVIPSSIDSQVPFPLKDLGMSVGRDPENTTNPDLEREFDPVTDEGKAFNVGMAYLNDITNSHHLESQSPEPSTVFAKCPDVPVIPPQDDIIPEELIHVELDSRGLPWDRRLHARTKTKNKDGSWKGLRGVGPVVKDRIESQLKTVQEIPAPPINPDVPVKDFAAMMTLITTGITDKKIERHNVMKVLSDFGIPSIPVAATRPDLIPGIIMALEEIINEPI